jgi:hypothetical protein
MDTANKLDNSGGDVVPYDAHLHRFYNINQGGYTVSGDSHNTGVTRFSPTDTANDFTQYFASTKSRLWEIAESLGIDYDKNETENLGVIYWDIRTRILSNPKSFIENYFGKYIENTGSIVYNYDYSVKYLTFTKTYDSSTDSYIEQASGSQAGYLHGTRVDEIKDWFEKRIYFLDSVFSDYQPTNATSITSPLNSTWSDNKAGAKVSGATSAVAVLAAKSKIKITNSLENST